MHDESVEQYPYIILICSPARSSNHQPPARYRILSVVHMQVRAVGVTAGALQEEVTDRHQVLDDLWVWGAEMRKEHERGTG